MSQVNDSFDAFEQRVGGGRIVEVECPQLNVRIEKSPTTAA
jgi:hypothetical protein